MSLSEQNSSLSISTTVADIYYLYVNLLDTYRFHIASAISSLNISNGVSDNVQ